MKRICAAKAACDKHVNAAIHTQPGDACTHLAGFCDIAWTKEGLSLTYAVMEPNNDGNNFAYVQCLEARQ